MDISREFQKVIQIRTIERLSESELRVLSLQLLEENRVLQYQCRLMMAEKMGFRDDFLRRFGDGAD